MSKTGGEGKESTQKGFLRPGECLLTTRNIPRRGPDSIRGTAGGRTHRKGGMFKGAEEDHYSSPGKRIKKKESRSQETSGEREEDELGSRRSAGEGKGISGGGENSVWGGKLWKKYFEADFKHALGSSGPWRSPLKKKGTRFKDLPRGEIRPKRRKRDLEISAILRRNRSGF